MLEEVVETVIGSEEVKLVVAGLFLGEGSHKLATILCHKQRSQSHDLEILGANVGHTRRELKIRGLRGPGRLLIDRGGSLAYATSGDGGAAPFLDFA